VPSKFQVLLNYYPKTLTVKYSIYVSIIFLIAFARCKDSKTKSNQAPINAANNKEWSQVPDTSTKTGQGYATPKFGDGLIQSPINILSFNTEKDRKHNINLVFKDEINGVENLGHTIQLNFTEGSTSSVDGKIYKFKQLHFHTPSEHLIDGMTFPMEMHVVNELKDKKDTGVAAYVVVAILYKMGRENKFIKEFISSVPREENKKENLQPGTVKLRDLFAGIPKNELKSYYQYRGSLTTPPYTESVDWIIKKYIFEASPEQMTAIGKIEGDNARHIQALYYRKVTSN
jgi:carbonic anhydrase